jgi:hypothetical protein
VATSLENASLEAVNHGNDELERYGGGEWPI